MSCSEFVSRIFVCKKKKKKCYFSVFVGCFLRSFVRERKFTVNFQVLLFVSFMFEALVDTRSLLSLK